jgi:hypothetical protein
LGKNPAAERKDAVAAERAKPIPTHRDVPLVEGFTEIEDALGLADHISYLERDFPA